MTDMTTELDELDVSPKTLSFLQGLGVSTLGELLSLPAIEGPRLVVAELAALFEELEVTYEGELRAKAAVAAHRAIGSVEERWKIIRSWLEKERPELLGGFGPPASADSVRAAEKAIGRALPDDYKRFLAIHDGQRGTAPMVEWCTLLAIHEVAERHASLVTLFRGEQPGGAGAVAAEIQPVVYLPDWIPIGVSPRGRDFLCLDLAPGAGGAVGQIISLALDDDARDVVAPTFADLLSLYFEGLQTGAVSIEDGDDENE